MAGKGHEVLAEMCGEASLMTSPLRGIGTSLAPLTLLCLQLLLLYLYLYLSYHLQRAEATAGPCLLHHWEL